MMRRKAYPTDLTDEQWALIAPLVMQPKGKPGRPREVDTREVVNAILYVVRTGCQWRMLPHDFPAWQTVYYYFNKWSRDGTWHQIMTLLRRIVRQLEGHDPEPTAGLMDSQSVKSTETSGDRGWDGGKKGQRTQETYDDRYLGLAA